MNNSFDKKFYDDPTHVHPYNPSSLEKLLQLNIFDHINSGDQTLHLVTDKKDDPPIEKLGRIL